MTSVVFNRKLIIFFSTFGLLYLSNPIVGVHFKNPEYKLPENHYYNPSAPSPPRYPSYSEADMKGPLDTLNTKKKTKGKKLKTALALGAAGLGAATLLGGGYHLYKRFRPQAAATEPSVPGKLTPTTPSNQYPTTEPGKGLYPASRLPASQQSRGLSATFLILMIGGAAVLVLGVAFMIYRKKQKKQKKYTEANY